MDGGADGGESADETLVVSAADATDESEARVGDDGVKELKTTALEIFGLEERELGKS